MYLTDFIYDGVKLSSLGYLVGSAVTSNNESASAGSKLELSTVYNRGNYITSIVDATYKEQITATFDIIKYACNDTADSIVEDREISYIMRWLNKPQYCKFKPLYDDASFPDVFFMGTFTEINTIQKGGNVVGFTLTFTSNAPYGYADYDDISFSLEKNIPFIYYDESDADGIHYPESMIIEISGNDDFQLYNDLTKKKTIINNCIGDTITFDCIHKTVLSNKSSQHTTFFKDFNYVFPGFISSYITGEPNILTSTMNCDVTLIYKPIRKVGIVV